MIPDKDLEGRLVYLTVHVDTWLRQLNSEFNVTMANRIAKVHKVFNWRTKEGKLLLTEREKTGKWKKLNSRDFKYVLKVYCPELVHENKKGLTVEEMLPRFFPGTQTVMFDTLPAWMLKDLQKEEKAVFKLLEKSSSEWHNKKKSSACRNVSG